MSDQLLVATRKGLFRLERKSDGWSESLIGFVGNPVTNALRRRARRAWSRPATTNAPPPTHGMTISSRWSGVAITREASTSSTVIGCPKNTADGFAHAVTRWSAASAIKSPSSSTKPTPRRSTAALCNTTAASLSRPAITA